VEKEVRGLGLLDVITEFVPEKSTTQVKAQVTADAGLLAGMNGREVTGYEIHMGQTKVNEKTSPFRITETPQGAVDYSDGAINEKGTVIGTYMHGLLHNDTFRETFLNNLRHYWGLTGNDKSVNVDKEKEYDKLADLVRGNLDMPLIYRIMEQNTNSPDR
jgi:adenosylcobyric acid synthase